MKNELGDRHGVVAAGLDREAVLAVQHGVAVPRVAGPVGGARTPIPTGIAQAGVVRAVHRVAGVRVRAIEPAFVHGNIGNWLRQLHDIQRIRSVCHRVCRGIVQASIHVDRVCDRHDGVRPVLVGPAATRRRREHPRSDGQVADDDCPSHDRLPR
jgi:hypothetical protein